MSAHESRRRCCRFDLSEVWTAIRKHDLRRLRVARKMTAEHPAAQDLLLATQSGEYAAGYDAGIQAVWDKWVCSACGFNHDEDESAACEGADVISFADWYGRASDFLRSIREWRGLT